MPGTVPSSEVSTVLTSVTQIRKLLNQDYHPASASDTANQPVTLFLTLELAYRGERSAGEEPLV